VNDKLLLSGLCPTAWGKLTRSPLDDTIATLGLIDHCADVAAVFRALADLPTIRRRLQALAGQPIDSATISRLTVLAFLHDIGKASLGFQSKALSDAQRLELLATSRLTWADCGHTFVIAPIFGRAPSALGLDEICAWGAATPALWLAAISHHGDPITHGALTADRWSRLHATWLSYGRYDPSSTLAALGVAARLWFAEAFRTPSAALPESPGFHHAFAGMVSLADWIASNPREGFFPYATPEGGDRMAFATRRAGEVLRAMRINVEEMREDLRRRSPPFEDIFRDRAGSGLQPRPLQASMAESGLGPIVIAEAETGSGKTEAALWRFKTLFEAGEVDSLAFVLPTRVAAVSIEARVRHFIETLFPYPELRPNVVLAAPGYLRVDGEDGTLLSGFETLWPDTADAEAAHRRWAVENSKRYLAACVAVGTVDQALLSALKVRHAHLRGAALMRSLLVVDEVHASDAYMTRLLVGLLRRHQAAGGHALLLSATLGSDARAALLDRTPRLKVGSRPVPADPLAAERAPYPAITDQAGLRATGGGSHRKAVTLDLRPLMDVAAEVARIAFEAAQTGARVLVVRNTVGDAVAVQQALETAAIGAPAILFRVAGLPFPHHGRFAAEDRRILDAAVETAFGKDALRERGLVLTGTQTLEQSLDIDADLLVTDLAPIDVLLQRIGRLHRHPNRARPSGFEQPRVVILTPTKRDLAPLTRARRGVSRHGLGSAVYDNLLSVEASWCELESRPMVTIPDDNRVLVERGTNGERLRLIAERLGGPWPEHWRHVIGGEMAKRMQAGLNALTWEEFWNDIQWPELSEQVRTRLGLDDRLVALPRPWTSPLGQSLSRMKVPGWMVPAQAADSPAEIIEEAGAGLVFSWGERLFRYDRYGLRRDSP
jgi:CRISPR-associated endonuclease/helicase Cas3